MNKNKLPIIELDINSRPTKFDLMYGVCADPDCDCNSIIVSLINNDYEINFAIDLKSGNYINQDYSKKEKKIINAFIKFIKSSKNYLYNIDFFKKTIKK